MTESVLTDVELKRRKTVTYEEAKAVLEQNCGFTFDESKNTYHVGENQKFKIKITLREGVLDIDSTNRFKKTIRQIQALEEEEKSAKARKAAFVLPKGLEKKFAASEVDGGLELRLTDRPHIARRIHKAGNVEAQLAVLATTLERDADYIQAMETEAKKFAIRVENKSEAIGLVQPDLGIRREVARNAPRFVDAYIAALNDVRTQAADTALERYVKAASTLEEAGLGHALAPQGSQQLAETYGVRDTGTHVSIPTYGADIIARKTIENLGKFIAGRVPPRVKSPLEFASRNGPEGDGGRSL